jgi:hypothetical protein
LSRLPDDGRNPRLIFLTIGPKALVSTVFIHGREAHLSSALRAFLDLARAGAIAPDDTGDHIKSLPRAGLLAVN